MLKHKRGAPLRRAPLIILSKFQLELWTSSNQSLTSLIGCILIKVLDEASCQILCLLFPFAITSISVTWVKNTTVNTFQNYWNLEVEVRNVLSLYLVDVTVQNSVDDTTSISNRDSLTSTIPTSVMGAIPRMPDQSKQRM